MAALELAQTTLADTPALSVPTKFLDGLVEKGYLTEENKDAILADEELCRFIKTTKKRARKTPAKKVSASDSERDSEEYDTLRCPCRIWKPIPGCGDVGLMNVQCSKKLPDGSTMCNMHSNKLDDDGNWWLGLVTEDPPAEPFFQPGKKKAHYWSVEAKEEEKEKKKSTKKTKKKVEDDEEEVEEKPKKVKKTKKVTKEEEEEGEGSDDEEEVEDDEEEVEEKPKKEKKAEKVTKKKVEEEEGNDDEEEEEDDGNTPFVFEGVEYLRTEDGDIVDPENFDLMGEDDGHGGIDWSDEDMMKKHEEKKGK
jgi:flagellar biosynthesis GTPase FlhF